MSTVSRGRQSLRSTERQAVGRLKGTRSIFLPSVWGGEHRASGHTRAHTHTHTHTLSVFRATGARTIRLTAPDTRPHTGRSRLRSVCVKCFVRKIPLSAQTATVGCPSRWALSGFRPFLPGHPLSIEQAFVSSLISGPVSVLIRWEKGDSEAVKSSGPPLRSVPQRGWALLGPAAPQVFTRVFTRTTTGLTSSLQGRKVTEGRTDLQSGRNQLSLQPASRTVAQSEEQQDEWLKK